MDATTAIAAAREAQSGWETLRARQRVSLLEVVRRSIGVDPKTWAASCSLAHHSEAEGLAAEVGPLADGVAWLSTNAERVLAPRRGEGGWFDALKSGSLHLGVQRKPLGVVLVIGAGNYPLFLLAVPALQALAAGNAALLKPPPGGEGAARLLHDTLVEGGVDARLCPVLDESAESAEAAIDAGVDYVVLTGSADTGRAVARRAAERLTPCTLECSGSDPVIVLPEADVDRVADCVAWGLTFNAGATCIGPRRLIYVGYSGEVVFDPITERLSSGLSWPVSATTADRVRDAIGAELESGAVIHHPAGWTQADLAAACDAKRLPGLVFMPTHSPTQIGETDLFAPVIAIEIAKTVEQAISWANASPYALGASVFGPPAEAEAVARRLRAGCVTVNDLIAPTADPRVPFGGAGESGYGITRGREGLLAMTRPQAIVRRRGRWLPHLDPETPALPDLLTSLIQMRHATGLAARWRAMRRFFTAANEHQKQKKDRR